MGKKELQALEDIGHKSAGGCRKACTVLQGQVESCHLLHGAAVGWGGLCQEEGHRAGHYHLDGSNGISLLSPAQHTKTQSLLGNTWES